MKKLLAFALALTLALSLAACGGADKTPSDNGNTPAASQQGGNNDTQEDPNNPGSSNSDSEYHGNTDGAADLKNVTDKNYKEVAKAVFGIDVKEVTGLELQKAESLNGVNDLVITYSGSDQDAKATLAYYFENCKNLSGDGVYSVNVNWENYSVSKGTKYEEFEAFYGTEATEIGTLYQCKWIYDNNGSNVQLAISIDEQITTITFGLLG